MMATAERTNELERCIAAFESAWSKGSSPDPMRFLPSGDRDQALLELLRVEFELRWERGERDLLNQFRIRHPDLFTQPSAVALLAFEEYRQRIAAGESPDRREYEQAFGISTSGWPESKLLPQTVEITAVRQPTSSFPVAGDRCGPYRIVAILGHGSFGRVYLAEETDLSNRRVALKLSTKFGRLEPEILARLQHTNIVPVYSASKIGTFQSTVMPFLGATTVADLIDSVRGQQDRPRSGSSILETIAAKRGSTLVDDAHSSQRSVSPPKPLTDLLASYSYSDAILWMIGRLAGGLHHAHQRGVIHRDIKPANILLTDDGTPMLLDFNLAATVDRSASWGGTPAYMAPELRNQSVAANARTDLFSLGIVAYELLTGSRPERSDAIIPLRDLNPSVSASSAAIIEKCLMAVPSQRFAAANDLAEEIERQLRSQRLAIVHEPSRAERWRKWAKRHPRLSSTAFVSCVAAVLLVSLFAVGWSWRASSIRLGEQRDAVRKWDEFQSAFPSLLDRLAFQGDGQSRDIRDSLSHWQDRLATIATKLDPEQRRQFGWDWGVLNLLIARQAHDESTAKDALERSLNGFHETGMIPESVRAEWRKRFGSQEPFASDPGQADGGDDFLQGVQDYRQRRFKQAVGRFEHAVRLDPSMAWGWLALGNARYELGQWATAESAFQSFIVLKPHEPMGFYNRGLCRVRLNQTQDAIDDFNETLIRVPEHRKARYQRGLAYSMINQLKSAKADFDALLLSEVDVSTLIARANVLTKLGDTSAAARDRHDISRYEPATEVDYVARGMDRIAHDQAREAIRDFDAAIALNSRSFFAWQNRAYVQDALLHDEPAAIDSLMKLLTYYPDAVESRAGMAVLLARQNRRDRAHAEAKKCLSENTSAEVIYQMANVYALTSRTNPEDRPIALRHLKTALNRGFGHPLLATDPDLAPIRGTQEFRQLADAVRTLSGPTQDSQP